MNALGNTTGNDRAGGSGKRELKEELGQQRNRCPVQGAEDARIVVAHQRTIVGAAQHPAVQTHEGIAVAEHDGEADEPEGDRRKTKDDEVLTQNIDRVLGAAESGLDKSETCVHPKNQKARDQHPDGVGHDFEVHIGGAGVVLRERRAAKHEPQ